MRAYELCFIADPRLSDEEVVALTDDYKQMLTAKGAQLTKEESWGRRKLAYPIEKMTEGRYVLLGFDAADGSHAIPDVEHRLLQNDKILRFLTVRIDLDLKRAAKKPPRKTAAAAAESGEQAAREE